MNKKVYGLLGGLATLIGLVVTLLDHFQKDKPLMVYGILSRGNVFEVREKVSDFRILFQGEDIQKNHQALKFLTVRISNQGNTTLLQNLFDQNLPWGN